MQTRMKGDAITALVKIHKDIFDQLCVNTRSYERGGIESFQHATRTPASERNHGRAPIFRAALMDAMQDYTIPNRPTRIIAASSNTYPDRVLVLTFQRNLSTATYLDANVYATDGWSKIATASVNTSRVASLLAPMSDALKSAREEWFGAGEDWTDFMENDFIELYKVTLEALTWINDSGLDLGSL